MILKEFEKAILISIDIKLGSRISYEILHLKLDCLSVTFRRPLQYNS